MYSVSESRLGMNIDISARGHVRLRNEYRDSAIHSVIAQSLFFFSRLSKINNAE